eukprot:scaffold2144_cov215-Pinguiococcus_pyrenoidosus.AAC.3
MLGPFGELLSAEKHTGAVSVLVEEFEGALELRDLILLARRLSHPHLLVSSGLSSTLPERVVLRPGSLTSHKSPYSPPPSPHSGAVVPRVSPCSRRRCTPEVFVSVPEPPRGGSSPPLG